MAAPFLFQPGLVSDPAHKDGSEFFILQMLCGPGGLCVRDFSLRGSSGFWILKVFLRLDNPSAQCVTCARLERL
jgi:hypothetical protein